MLLGLHVSAEGKIYESLERAKSLGCNTMQIFSRNPQRWRDGFVTDKEAKEFQAKRKKLEIDPVFVHISYLINLASPNKRLYHGSIEAYIEDMLEAEALGADYIVTHMGSHKDTSEELGIKRLIDALNIILDKTKIAKAGILLENTSGAGSWLGYKFAHHKAIIQGVKQKNRVGLCLDTAHAYLAGYDITTESGLEAMLSEIDKAVGLKLIKLIHLNDADGELGSKRDRHESIGKGSIGASGLKRIINHKELKYLPFILETPKRNETEDKDNLEAVKRLRK